MNTDKEIVCPECDSKFTKRKSLYAHQRRIHDNVGNKDPMTSKKLKIKNAAKELCSFCGKMFTDKSNFQRHLKQFHRNEVYENKLTNSRIKCPCQNCIEVMTCHKYLIIHLRNEHNIEVDVEELQFESQLEFKQWKNKVQEAFLSFYALDTSSKLLADGNKKEYYNCHRSYSYKGKGKNKRALKSTGTNKIGTACPSRIEVLIKNNGGPITVKFWKTHIGHTCDIDRILISKEVRAEIAGKLKEGVTFEHILDTIHDSGLQQEESKRILLLEKKDIHNIVRDFNINYNTKRHQNDAISVKLWVAEMQNLEDDEMQNLEDDDPVLFYKEQYNAMIDNILETNTTASNIQATPNNDIKTRAELVIGLCETVKLTEGEHRYILNQFDKIIKTLNKEKTVSTKETHIVNDNENIKKQVPLFSTKKKSKKSAELKKPSVVEKRYISENLLNKSNATVHIHTGFDHSYV